MEREEKVNYLKKKLNFRNKMDKVKRYALVAGAALGFAYLADRWDAASKIEEGLGKAKQGIEYVIEKYE